MGFRNPIQKLSDLEADVITGATIRTQPAPESRFEITPGHWLRWYTGNTQEVNTGKIDSGDQWDPPSDAMFAYMELWTPTLRTEAGPNGYDAGLVMVGQDTKSAGSYAELYADGILLNRGRHIGGLDYGAQSSVTPDGSGIITQTHTLGVAPGVVFVQSRNNGANRIFTVTEKNTTNFKFRVANDAGSILTSSQNYDWLALAAGTQANHA
jgi:hypothetical protein